MWALTVPCGVDYHRLVARAKVNKNPETCKRFRENFQNYGDFSGFYFVYYPIYSNFAPCNNEQMVETLRNIIAFTATFVVIATVVMMLAHSVIAIAGRNMELSERQERYVVWTGIVIALLLIPFYYFPA